MIATVTLNPSLDEWMELPSLRLGTLNRASGFARYPGGKGLNVSRVIRELGASTVAFGLAGGEDGTILLELMNRLSLRHVFVTVAGTTRNNYKIRTLRPRGLTEINMSGPEVSLATLRTLRRRLLTHRPRPSCIVLSGSVPPGVPASTYREWALTFRRLNIPCALDASGAALQQGLRARPWFVKPNRDEAEELLGRRLTGMRSVVKGVQELLRLGPAVAIISLGASGALMASAVPSGVWFARPPSVTVDSAVGAGDSLVGGFLTGWVQRRSLVEAFRLGVACGAATAMTPGTELCHRRDVQRLLPRVTLRRLA
jgi:1-phosphofructokinase family hexose kinase